MNRILHIACVAGLAAAGVLATPALGEVATQDGFFAAPNREASYLQRIAIDRFNGRVGQQVEEALERQLMQSSHFQAMSATGGGLSTGGAQGLLSGTALSSVDRSRYDDYRQVCVQKDGDKCVKRERRKQPCFRQTVSLRVNLRLERISDGRIVYAEDKPQQNTYSWCPGDREPESPRVAIQRMVDNVAMAFLADISPARRHYSIRFRESRKGMPKDIGRRFKDTVKLSKHDVDAACRQWQAIDADMPNHPSVVFDLALCAEHAGDYAGALALYQRARQLIGGSGNEADEGIDRIHRLIAGREDERRFAAQSGG